ncbi:MAG: MBL fold metallo-hydrolase [Anaerovoracaceae bacterium]|jgi:7,8-dihydropterin-6-yl-methyl-4-(beta-D-ribofuranosyl)aminobenzene 5'-phosphate synthase
MKTTVLTVTVLVENTTEGSLPAEHGLSLYLEYGGHCCLLDFGASALFAENARRMGIDLAAVDLAFISHAHNDHTTGLEAFFRLNRTAPVYLRRGAADGTPISRDGPGRWREIGMPAGILERDAQRFRLVDDDFEAADGIWLIGHKGADMRARAEATGMYRRIDGAVRADDFSHEQSVVFRTSGGLVVLNSCSHGGVRLILREAAEAFPGERIAAFIGGFHLKKPGRLDAMAYSPEQIAALGADLAAIPDVRYYTGHCTGASSLQILKQQLGDRVEALHTGKVFEIGGE